MGKSFIKGNSGNGWDVPITIDGIAVGCFNK
jgi:hypothetical protein